MNVTIWVYENDGNERSASYEEAVKLIDGIGGEFRGTNSRIGSFGVDLPWLKEIAHYGCLSFDIEGGVAEIWWDLA